MGYDEQEYSQKFSIRTWKRLLPFVSPYKKAFALMLFFNCLTALMDVLLPLFQRYAVDEFIEAGTLNGLWVFALCYLGAIMTQTLAVLGMGRNSMFIEMTVGRDMRRAAFTHLQTLSFSYYNVTPVGYILSRVMSDTMKIAGIIGWALPDVIWAVFYLTGAFNEGITGAKTSKTLVIERDNTESFRRLTGEMYESGVKATRVRAVYVPLVLFLSTMAVAVILVRGGQLSLQGLIELGTLSAFTTYAVGIFEPVQLVAEYIAEFISIQASIERVTGLLDTEPLVKDTPEVVEKYGDSLHPKRENWEPIRGDIEFRDVTFRYPDGGEDVLSHFNLKIPAGTTVAIVGETGAGKSTLVNLACRFFEPTSGQILIDGRDYRERSQLWLHSAIGYVLQSPHLFSGSVRENIRYGRLDATDEEIEAAARAVSADRVVERLENGWDSDVGEGGDKLSTGEKQLISFARAVLADPRIFVLDEATSSIDTQTEQLIQDAIEHILTDRTSFLIAHRLSTIRRADLILVVHDGRIVEQGTHRELLMKKGYYHELYSKQFAEESAQRILQ